jgi:hypothetical protein
MQRKKKRKVSPAGRAAMSAMMLKRRADPEYKARVIAKKRSPEAVERMRQSQLGKVQSVKHNRAIARGVREKWRDKVYRRAQEKERAMRFGKVISLDMYAGWTDAEVLIFVTGELKRIQQEEKEARLRAVRAEILARYPNLLDTENKEN